MELYGKQIVEMKQYRYVRDLLKVLLKPDIKYELTQVDEMLEKFLNGKENE